MILGQDEIDTETDEFAAYDRTDADSYTPDELRYMEPPF
jgi:hypothetical protein